MDSRQFKCRDFCAKNVAYNLSGRPLDGSKVLAATTEDAYSPKKATLAYGHVSILDNKHSAF